MNTGITISLSSNGITKIENTNNKNIRKYKGKNLIKLPTSFVVIDIETTGLDPNYDEVIEVAAIKVVDGKVIDEFSSLVKPNDCYEFEDEETGECLEEYVDDFITLLTGITNEMLETAPAPTEVFPKFFDFVGDSILLGHNVNFDINFLYDLNEDLYKNYFSNDFIDLMRLTRKVYPNFKNHKLATIAKELNVNGKNHHRALADCYITFECYNLMCNQITEKNIELKSLWAHLNDLSKLEATTNKFNDEHIFYDKNIVFTGKLDKMERKTAAQLVVDIGGHCLNGVTKKANFLILGNLDYCSNIKGGKSSKIKKAEKYILEEQDLTILSEDVFYDLMLDVPDKK